MCTLVAVMMSTWRPGTVVTAAIEAALNAPEICSVHVWGYEPTGRAIYHTVKDTSYHTALSEHLDHFPLSYLANGNKFAGNDDKKRIKWRARLCLDMWAVMTEARELFPTALLLYLENDAIVDGRLGTAVARLKQSNAVAAACYGKGIAYMGGGNLCFLLTPDAKPEPHILAYHMVQPADWIISDYSKNTWPIYEAVSHGFIGRIHKSTMI
jgi:hypothetical protein